MTAQHRAAASLLSCVTLIGAGALLMTGCADEREATGTTPAVTSGETTVTTAQSDPSDESVPVVLDYSPTISDAGALLYLAGLRHSAGDVARFERWDAGVAARMRVGEFS